jgi:hypothetical protein
LPLLVVNACAFADGIVVDRVYDPYVQPLETEIEWRSILQSGDETADIDKHIFGVGRSLSDRFALELYAIGTREGGESLDIDAFEAELRWQITEQGEFAFDWGAVFELERDTGENVWEASASVVAARDLGRWTALANLGLVYEWGGGVGDEIETDLHLQARYRMRESFEPAIELHMGQDTAVLGPVLTGLIRTAPGRKLRWEAGLFLPLDNASPDRVVRLNFEYEF